MRHVTGALGRAIIGMIALLSGVTASAQPPAIATDPAVASATAVTIITTLGPIVLALEKDRAPVTTANFLRYVDARRFDGMTFYRAMTLGPDLGLIQGGVRDARLLYPPIAHEPTSATGLRHVDGTISMARGVIGSATADFFITIGAIPSLDADPALPGDNQGFAAFGHVVAGMDVVRRIEAAPTWPTLGEGVMKGQMIAEPIRILSARRTP